ncbi:hypothetical protein OROHE_010235 [Orobanche hederae]
MVYSSLLLGRRYSAKEILGCFLVAAEVVVAVMSGGNYCRMLSGIGPLWSAVIIASSVFQAVAQFVDGLFKSITYTLSFKDCIRDFLVKSKEFSAQLKMFTLSNESFSDYICLFVRDLKRGWKKGVE